MKTTATVFKEVLEDLGFSNYKPSEMTNSDYFLCTYTAMNVFAKHFSDQQTEKLKKDLEEKDKENQKLQYEISDLKKDYDGVKSEVKSFKDLNNTLRDRNIKLQSQLSEKEKELSELKAKHKEDVINAIIDNLYESGDDDVQQDLNYRQAIKYYKNKHAKTQGQ